MQQGPCRSNRRRGSDVPVGETSRMTRHWAKWVAGAVGLALMIGGVARADVPAYSFQSLATLDSPLPAHSRRTFEVHDARLSDAWAVLIQRRPAGR